ncbi:MAG TPA: arsenate reductase ArsC [Actinomycetota bacterium]|jgi:arsenate reductase
MTTRVLFVCVHNGGRSVMAEAFFNALSDGGVEALSAGTEPQASPHPEVVEVMREAGIDVSGHRGALLDDDLVRSAQRVITMGCAVDSGACPAILYANTEDWGLPDPKGQPPERVREIRDQVRARVEQLLEQLVRSQ